MTNEFDLVIKLDFANSEFGQTAGYKAFAILNSQTMYLQVMTDVNSYGVFDEISLTDIFGTIDIPYSN